MIGYSGTPLHKKLGIQGGASLYIENMPDEYPDLVSPLPENVTFCDTLESGARFIHIFVKSYDQLSEALPRFLTQMAPDGVVWVSWFKKSSKILTDVTEDTIREVALPIGLVDIKVCAVSEIWSGLKLVIRRENRPHFTT